jgi:hypothetical protein
VTRDDAVTDGELATGNVDALAQVGDGVVGR